MTLVFGKTQVCRFCQGSGKRGTQRCLGCNGSGFSGGKQAVARHSDPETSHEAAASLTADRIRASQTLVLHWLKEHGPMTDELLVTIAKDVMSPSGARTRRSELVGLGKVRDSGRRETLASGRRAIVWEAV